MAFYPQFFNSFYRIEKYGKDSIIRVFMGGFLHGQSNYRAMAKNIKSIKGRAHRCKFQHMDKIH